MTKLKFGGLAASGIDRVSFGKQFCSKCAPFRKPVKCALHQILVQSLNS